MQPQVQMQYSDLKFSTPIMATDGNMIMVTDNNLVNILFFQMRMKDNGQPSAEVVSAVRLHNLNELKDFHRSIGDVIKQHESKEK